jgi:hypothetical protein
LLILLNLVDKFATATVRAYRINPMFPTECVVSYEVPLARGTAEQEGGVSAPLARGGRRDVLQDWDEVRSTAHGAIMFAVRYEAIGRRGHCHYQIKVKHLVCCNL